MSNYVIFGVSWGFGAVFVVGLLKNGDKVWVVFCCKFYYLDKVDGVEWNWIKVDLVMLMDVIFYIK